MPEINRQMERHERARVAVVGAGIVSPLGFGLAETAEALRQGRDCVTEVTQFCVEQCRCKTAGQIRDDQLRAAGTTQLQRSERLHRAARMVICALEQVLAQAPHFEPQLTVVGTTSGGMTFGEQYYRSLQRGDETTSTPQPGSRITCRKSRLSMRKPRSEFLLRVR